jgi:hypothetical protein
VTYTQQGDKVTLEMTRENFEQLTFILGTALGNVTKQAGTGELFWNWLRFVNELNTGNPNFTPYEIPQEYLPKTREESDAV